MSLNIKNPRVHELAREAAQRFGMSQTSVIEEALVRMLAAHHQASAEAVEASVHELLAKIDRQLSDEDRRALRGHDQLYDERGLPA